MFGLKEFIALVVLALLVWFWYAMRRIAGHLVHAQEMKVEFSKATHILIKDKRTPDIVIDSLVYLAENLNNWPFVPLILWAWFDGELRESWRNPTLTMRKYRCALQKMPAELRLEHQRAASAFALSISYRTFIFGWIFRRLLVLWAETDQEIEEHQSQNNELANVAYGRIGGRVSNSILITNKIVARSKCINHEPNLI